MESSHRLVEDNASSTTFKEAEKVIQRQKKCFEAEEKRKLNSRKKKS